MNDKAIAVREKVTSAVKYSEEEISVIERVCCPPEATKPQIKMFLLWSASCGLNPLKRECYFVLMDGKPIWMAGVDGLQRRADEHPDYGGMDGPFVVYENDDFEFDAAKGEVIKHVIKAKDRGKPVQGWVKVYRKGRRPTVLLAFFEEFNAQNKPTWRKMPDTMFCKCLRAKGLKVTFSSELGSVYAEEEMDRAIEERKVENLAAEGVAPKTKEELIEEYKGIKDRWPATLRLLMIKRIIGAEPKGGAETLTTAELGLALQILREEPPETPEEAEEVIKSYLGEPVEPSTDAVASTETALPGVSEPPPSTPPAPPSKNATTRPVGAPEGKTLTPVKATLQEELKRVGEELVLAGIMAVAKQAKKVHQLTDFEAQGVLKWLEKHEPPAGPIETPAETQAPEPKKNEEAVPEGDDWAYCPTCVKPVYEESNDDGAYLVNPDGSPHACQPKATEPPPPPKRESVAQKIADQKETFPCYYCAKPMPLAVAKMFQRRNNYPACTVCGDKIAAGQMEQMRPPVAL